ncbi:MAG TPA: hypothetical protein VI756_05450, partial [Blastocatellia bacterium]
MPNSTALDSSIEGAAHDVFITGTGSLPEAGQMAGSLPRRDKLEQLAMVFVRSSYAMFLILTSVYCVLAFNPFTYADIVRFSIFSWLPSLIRLHPLLYWTVFAALSMSLRRDLLEKRTRLFTAGFILFGLLAGVRLSIRPLLSNLSNDGSSLILGFVTLLPLLWVAAIDFRRRPDRACWKASADNKPDNILFVVLATLAYLLIIHLLLGLVLCLTDNSRVLSGREVVIGELSSLLAHFTIFAFLYVVLRLIQAATARLNSTKAEFICCDILAMLAVYLFMKNMVLASISFSGPLARLYALALSMSLILFTASLSMRMWPPNAPIDSGLELVLLPLLAVAPKRSSSWRVKVLSFVLVALVCIGAPLVFATTDWDFLAQKILVLFVWVFTFVVLFSILPPKRAFRNGLSIMLVLLMAALAANRLVARWQQERTPVGNGLSISEIADRYSAYDVSCRLARGILSTPVDLRKVFSIKSAVARVPQGNADGKSAAEPPPIDPDTFFGFLKQNTNILPTEHVKPVDIQLTDGGPARTQWDKPNIFIVVVDSLRPDYLSPYN